MTVVMQGLAENVGVVDVCEGDIGRFVVSRASCCAVGDAAVGGTVLSVFIAEEDAEIAIAAERLRTGRYGYRFCKRAFDNVSSLFVLVCLSWLYLIIAIDIKLNEPHGPIIFVQKRVGKDGCAFRMYKFRSMVVDAETRLTQLLERNEKMSPVFKMTHDSRVTRVEQALTCYRQTRLDRDSITFDEWVNLYLLYIRRCSLWTDL